MDRRGAAVYESQKVRPGCQERLSGEAALCRVRRLGPLPVDAKERFAASGVPGPPRAARGVLRMPSEVSALGDTVTRKDILSMAGRDSLRLAERRETSE